MNTIFLMTLTLIGFAAGQFAFAQDTPDESVPVSKILDVRIEVSSTLPPPILSVTVKGEVPGGGYTKPTLRRVVPKTPPDDGMLDYYFTASPPEGPATTAITEILATDRWSDVVRDARWIKGVRVHAAGDTVQEVMLDLDQIKGITMLRQFEGVSDQGSFDEALEKALAEMNVALSKTAAVDGMATWYLGPVSGRVGGFAGFNQVKVIIYASRSPAWD